MLVIETNMNDGIDLVHNWTSVDDAWNSGRLDYLSEQGWMEKEELEELYECTNIQELIEKVSYPFYLVESV